jgi:hypothetical protein
MVVGALIALAPPARADVDPASDVLLLQNVFLPYKPKVCSQLAGPLRHLTSETKKAKFPLKVAVISSQADLGGAPQFLGRPQEYARFLGNELGIYGPDYGKNYQSNLSLLTVMSGGFGFYRSGKAPNVSKAVDDLSAPAGSQPNDLARAAIAAVPKLAKAAGHPVPTPKLSSGCSSGSGGSSFVVFAAPLGFLVLAAGIVALVNRRRRLSDS